MLFMGLDNFNQYILTDGVWNPMNPHQISLF